MIEAKKFNLHNEYKKEKTENNELSADDWDRIAYGVNLLRNTQIYIASDAPYTIDDICIKSSKLKREKILK